MSRRPTFPPTDHKMWRNLVARAHPDAGGDHDLFIWSRAVMEAICSGTMARSEPDPPRPQPRREQPSTSEPDRVPFEREANFVALTRREVAMAGEGSLNATYTRLLRLLYDCQLSPMHGAQERRGASYKMLATIGHKCGMSKSERTQWYRIAESIPLSDRHAGHILSRLKRENL